MRNSSVLVLPSLEEGFGLVVPQALNCGCPSLVSDRVGAKDLIRHHANGSIFPVKDAATLAAELEWWAANPLRVQENFTWTSGARALIAASEAALSR
jgi:glycosyltransferase involved in cell wall biosynthesis